MSLSYVCRRTARLYIFILLQITFRFDSLEPSSPRHVVDRRGLESVPPGVDSVRPLEGYIQQGLPTHELLPKIFESSTWQSLGEHFSVSILNSLIPRLLISHISYDHLSISFSYLNFVKAHTLTCLVIYTCLCTCICKTFIPLMKEITSCDHLYRFVSLV